MHCRICSSHVDAKPYMVKEMQFGYRDQFSYFSCPECGCLQIEEYPKNIEKYYGKNYYSFKQTNGLWQSIKKFLNLRRDLYAAGSNNPFHKLLFNLKPNFGLQSAFKIISEELKNSKSKKILDVGCGAGVFLEVLDGLGFRNLYGVDPFISEDFKINNRACILKKNFNEVQEKFDLIFFQHSLEHMPNQDEIAAKIESLLSDDGVCIIKIPLSSSYAWEQYGVNWFQLDAPRHFYLHSIKSINKLLNKVNLFVYKTVYDSTEFQILGSEFYKRDIPYVEWSAANQNQQIFSAQEIEEFKSKAIELNNQSRGDQAIFFVKKTTKVPPLENS